MLHSMIFLFMMMRSFLFMHDASLAGSLPASNKGDAPAKPPQIITTNTLSNIKLPVLQKDDYDTWAMEMEHYLEYIDNEVWKVIQNGNSKKRVTKGKDGVYRVLPPTTQEEQFADEKERKARTLLLMAVPKDHLKRFHGMDDAKEIWAAIKTRFGGKTRFKSTKAGRGQDFKPVRTEKEALMTIDEGQINWVEQTTDEELNHALMAFTVNNEVSMCSKLCLDSYNALQAKYDELQSEFEQEDIDDSLYEYGKHGPQPKSPSPTVSNASSIVFSICPSHDSDGELGTVFNANSTVYSSCQSNDNVWGTRNFDPSCAQHVKTPRQPIRTPVTPSPIPSYNRQNWNQRMERELGAGYSFERKPCFVCGSLSHLIKDCDYYEKKMAREAAFKSTRVVHANVRQATPAWTNSNRVNKANQFTPRPVQLNNIRPNLSTASKTIKTGRVNVNTGHGNVSSVSSAGTQFKSGASRFNTGKQHVSSGRVNRPVSNNTSPKPSQVNLNSPKKCLSKQRSLVNRPFSRNTA
ncbi:hypothetical protein Tco_0487483 [Tanacetum coccineum]